MLRDFASLSHQGIQTLHPYVPGKSIEELARELGISNIIKMASNENPLGCSPLVKEALVKLHSTQIATYPSPLIHPLRRKLSEELEIEEEKVILANGTDALFTLLLILFGMSSNKHILTHDKAFISYAIQAQTLGIPIKFSPLLANWEVDTQALIEACDENTALIFLANPNNPTGVGLSEEAMRALLCQVPETTIVVIDEAYHEFCKLNENSLSLLETFPNLVITRTFSKAYGLAGLRLGYAMAHPAIIELLARVQLPFTVSQAALAAGCAALDDKAFLAETLALNKAGLAQLRQGLGQINVLSLPSFCNFITFDCQQAALPVYQKLLQQGIIVRPLGAYALPNHLRVTVGKPEQNERFLNALASIISANHV